MPRYQSFAFQAFGKGLNLRDKPDAVEPSEAIDALNVIFTDRGAIEQRAGYEALTGTALTNRPDSLEAFYTSSGTKQLVAGCGTRLEALNTSGAIVSSLTGLTEGPWDFARFGKPNEEALFAGNGKDTLRKWNGSAWSTPKATVIKGIPGEEVTETEKAMPKAHYLEVTPWDNRLMAAGFGTTTGGPNGETSSPSHVYFSDAGNPESWHTLSSEQLTPGDGEKIQAVVAWREFVFVFKESKFFVFYGTSVDEEGLPEFNYRPVAGGVGLVSPRAVCAHHTGVYFLGKDGVYKTTGQEPELISPLVSPIFLGGASAFYQGGTLIQSALTSCAMTAFGDRIYLSFPTESTNNRTLVFDTRYSWWSLYDLPCAALTTFKASSTEELVFGYAVGVNKVGRHGPSYTNDAGTAITSRWRSGWFDLGSADDKKIRARKIWGTGNSQMGISDDFEESVGTLSNLSMEATGGTQWGGSTWGGGLWSEVNALIGQEIRVATRGTAFSMYFANATLNQNWSVHRIELLVPSVREPGVIQK